ncbi:hypothetical protein EZI54_17970 [Marinobacter halodurans]|uniref:DUF6160 domain-containing protein n=1 Tax=Marinobacter halodurans TaxID=2528979 RepID=A0ABY1ZGI1_9GAMM|nr:DUF6160 family protein [Marinobacter halodurans]TBW50785.1 hypothetical protein EZI54_17970 [Marinobacter halodurans]
MTGLQRTALCLPLLVIPPCTLADIEALDDKSLSQVTGQSGVTIELATRIDLDRFSYIDEGSLSIYDLSLSDPDGSAMDNMELTVDVAGDGEVLEHGFSEMARRANAGQLDTGNPDVADALARYAVGGSFGKQFNAGDAVIHLGPIDSGDPTSLDDYLHSVDFALDIGAVKAEGPVDSTTMFSNIHLEGYLGPTDIVIRNAGDSTRTLANGDTVSDSELQLDTHFEITDGSLDWDVADVILLFNFAAVGIEGLQVHNRWGEDTAGHFGMASATARLSQGTSGRSGHEGLSIHNVEFRADIDMPVFKVGGTSIGTIQFEDFVISNTNMMVYGH